MIRKRVQLFQLRDLTGNAWGSSRVPSGWTLGLALVSVRDKNLRALGTRPRCRPLNEIDELRVGWLSDPEEIEHAPHFGDSAVDGLRETL